jgi:hypothetical protein
VTAGNTGLLHRSSFQSVGRIETVPPPGERGVRGD